MASEECDIPAASKRSLFKKSTWAKAKPTETEEALDLFSRSKEIFPDVVAENERRRKMVERSTPSGSIERADTGAQEEKRRRISDEVEDLEGSSNDDELTSRLFRGRSVATPQPPSAKLSSNSPKQERPDPKQKVQQAPPSNKTPQTEIISLSDSEDETRATVNNARPSIIDFDDDEPLKPLKPVIALPEPVSEDEEFPEFVARAREGARRRVFERLDPARSNARSESSSSDMGTPNSKATDTSRLSRAPTSAPDPVVQILITSRIEGTKPLILKRKLSQRLKDVRLGWCDKQVMDGQPVPESTKRQIFLTWRSNKVFDVTTCKSMGLKVDAQGKLRGDGDGFDAEGRVHLEAWTDEIFEEYKKWKAAERKRRALDPMEEEESESEKPKAKDEGPRLKIILKSRNYKEFKLLAGPKTLVNKMISVFRSENEIPGDKEISLYLDGDKLDPANLVSDIDLDDMTTIDAHVN